MVLKEQEFKDKAIEKIAQEMCLAARTAPKTRGVDVIETAVLTGHDLLDISGKMEEIFNKTGRQAFKGNCENVKASSCIVLIGAKKKTAGLVPCSFCGFKNCEENEKNGPLCAYNAIDLGIAAGSALSAAADKRIDNRLMWTIGMAALELKYLGNEVKIALGIPLSATGKNIFFDRK